MKDELMDYFYEVAKLTAQLSTCQSRKVGAVLVMNRRIVAVGYNGTPPNRQHCKDMTFANREEHHEWSRFNELHAEQNLISFCAKHGLITNKATLFLTMSPCIDCAKIIVAAGIDQVYYIEKYDIDDGLNFLATNGVKAEQQKFKKPGRVLI